MASRADLFVGLGGDGTVLRTIRPSNHHRAPVVASTSAYSASSPRSISLIWQPASPRSATGTTRSKSAPLDAVIGSRKFAAFNDIVVIRVPGEGPVAVDLAVEGHHFLSYAADAVIVATPTGSTACNFPLEAPLSPPPSRGSSSHRRRRTPCSTDPS